MTFLLEVKSELWTLWRF